MILLGFDLNSGEILPLIQPFRLGDIFLIQRLSRQATRLSLIRTLLYPQSPAWSAIKTVNPLDGAKVTTYVLRQQGNRLARAGFIQIQKRTDRPEADILLLSPALDTPTGHPAIWEKLLSFAVQEAARQKIARLFVEVPDQPLPVNTFAHVGFKLYKHQTIWRLSAAIHVPALERSGYLIRPATAVDDWGLERLYAAVTPSTVRRAEGIGTGEEGKAPILDGCGIGSCRRFVMEEAGEITGCVHLVPGRRGTWLRLWTDTLQPDNWRIHALLRFAVNKAQDEQMPAPVYMGVNDYHGGLRAILSDYGFAPFSDRANMVKPVLAWVRDAVPATVTGVETVGEIVPSRFIQPRILEQQPSDAERLAIRTIPDGTMPGLLPWRQLYRAGRTAVDSGHAAERYDHVRYFGHSGRVFSTQGDDIPCA